MDRARQPVTNALAFASLAFGALVLGGILAVWFVNSTTASWVGGFTAALAWPLALAAGAFAAWRLRRTRPRLPLAAAAAGIALGVLGLAFATGALPDDIRERSLVIRVANTVESPAAGELTLEGPGGVHGFIIAPPAGGSAVLRTPPLPSGRYTLTVALEDGRSGSGEVWVGRAHHDAIVLVGPEAVDIQQTHGD